MKYGERFENGIEYGKYSAKKRLALYEEYGEIFYNGNVKINLLVCPEYVMSETMKCQKEKAINNIERLKKIINGEIIDYLYIMYFNALKDTEWAEWKN